MSKVQVNVRFDADTLKYLQDWANHECEKNGYAVTVSDGVRIAVRKFFADIEKQKSGVKK
jgi:hypothetical protein